MSPIRTVAADDIPMSPSSSSSTTSMVAFSFTMVYRDSFEECSTMLHKKLSNNKRNNGRPHWGKWFSPSLIKNRRDVEELYGTETVEEFSKIVESVDKYGLFRPAFFENLFFDQNEE